ncbi:MAG TPA: hypothetical protein PLL69_03000 [Gemmatimonadales bacterium]|nr:hypothetical protein [Gemmatimonadales bacterium]
MPQVPLVTASSHRAAPVSTTLTSPSSRTLSTRRGCQVSSNDWMITSSRESVRVTPASSR